MSVMEVQSILAVLAVLSGVAVLAGLWWRRRRRKLPAERERLRRLAVNATGRITDGVLLETPASPGFSANPESTENSESSEKTDSSENPELLFYRYWASGVEYTAAQDVSSLRHLIPPQSCRPGNTAAVKYDPRRPSNSIVVCELWSGLRKEQDEIP